MSSHVGGVQDWRVQLFIQAATTAWFLYDYILTLLDEIHCIWRRQFSAVKLLSLFMRYAAFANLLSSAETFKNWHIFSDDGELACKIIWRLNAVTGAIFYAGVAVFIALRLYVLSGRKTKIPLLMLCIGMIFVCCNTYLNCAGLILPRPLSTGCYQSFMLGGNIIVIDGHASDPSAAYIAVSLGGMCCLFIAEIVVQIYTWRRTWKVIQEVKKLRARKSLLFYLLRDGTIALMVVTVWVIISTSVSSVDLTRTTIPCISIVVCRVITHLRRVQYPDCLNTTSHAKSWLTPQFMDNIGAPLEFADQQGNRADKDDDAEDVTVVHDNPLVACLQVAEFENRSHCRKRAMRIATACD